MEKLIWGKNFTGEAMLPINNRKEIQAWEHFESNYTLKNGR